MIAPGAARCAGRRVGDAGRRRDLSSRERRARVIAPGAARGADRRQPGAPLSPARPRPRTAAGRASLPRRVGDGGQARCLAAVRHHRIATCRGKTCRSYRAAAEGRQGNGGRLFMAEGRVAAALKRRTLRRFPLLSRAKASGSGSIRSDADSRASEAARARLAVRTKAAKAVAEPRRRRGRRRRNPNGPCGDRR